MSWYEELDKWAADYLPDMEYEKDAPLDRYTSFRIGGPARRMAFPRSGEAAVLLVSHALELGARPLCWETAPTCSSRMRAWSVW